MARKIGDIRWNALKGKYQVWVVGPSPLGFPVGAWIAPRKASKQKGLQQAMSEGFTNLESYRKAMRSGQAGRGAPHKAAVSSISRGMRQQARKAGFTMGAPSRTALIPSTVRPPSPLARGPITAPPPAIGRVAPAAITTTLDTEPEEPEEEAMNEQTGCPCPGRHDYEPIQREVGINPHLQAATPLAVAPAVATLSLRVNDALDVDRLGMYATDPVTGGTLDGAVSITGPILLNSKPLNLAEANGTTVVGGTLRPWSIFGTPQIGLPIGLLALGKTDTLTIPLANTSATALTVEGLAYDSKGQ